MEKLLKTGKTKAIGVSNYSKQFLEELLPHCKVVPAVNQIENREYEGRGRSQVRLELTTGRSISSSAGCLRFLQGERHPDRSIQSSRQHR